MFKGNKWKIFVQREDRKRVRKKHKEKTINKKNAWHQKTEICIEEGPVKEVPLEEITSAMKKMKLGIAS